jgi:hypothetical protein
MEVDLSVSFYDHNSFLNMRNSIHVSADSGVLFENKAKSTEFY